MKVKYVTIQREATEIYFQELLYIMSIVIITVLTLKPLEKTHVCDYSNESY